MFESECKWIINSIGNGYEITVLGHAIRINGVVDVWKKNDTVYDIVANKYTSIFDKNERLAFVKSLIETYPKRSPYKKTSKGGLSYKEFKNNLNNGNVLGQVNAEDYHWNLHKDKFEDDNLYFLIHSDMVKIGRSKSVADRIKALKTGLSNDYFCYAYTGKGFMEKKMHECFSEFRMKGEWFNNHWRFTEFIRKNKHDEYFSRSKKKKALTVS